MSEKSSFGWSGDVEDSLRKQIRNFKGLDRLYHYTQWKGLQGVIETGRMWASGALYLNDSNELVSAFDRLINYIEGDQLSSGLVDLLKKARGFAFASRTMKEHNYLICFSSVCDDLSQWRAYGGTQGFCIEYDATSLLKNLNERKILFGKCLYHDTDVLPLLRSAVEPFLRDFTSNIDPSNPTHMKKVFELIWVITQIARFIKDAGFASETEYRICLEIARDDHGIKYRMPYDLIKPYFELEMPVTFIRKIWIGPGLFQGLNREAVAQFLVSKNLSEIEVVTSSVPYRQRA